MQKILFPINDTSPNHVLYTKTQLQGDGCTQLFIHIFLINWLLLRATGRPRGEGSPMPQGFAELTP